MKKLWILAIAAMFAGVASAQNYMVVNTETVFKSIAAYNTAVEEINKEAEQYQQNIDNAYAQLEEQYEAYMSQKASLSQYERQQYEATILANEQKIAEYQESIFGNEGTIAKLQESKLEPHRKKVTETIQKYATEHGYSLVLDIATNPTVLYYGKDIDKTQQIIELIK